MELLKHSCFFEYNETVNTIIIDENNVVTMGKIIVIIHTNCKYNYYDCNNWKFEKSCCVVINFAYLVLYFTEKAFLSLHYDWVYSYYVYSVYIMSIFFSGYKPGSDVLESQMDMTTDELLIACVAQKPALYDHRLPVSERTVLKKNTLWKEVCNMMGGI